MCVRQKLTALQRASCPLLDFLVWWKCIKCHWIMPHNSTAVGHYHIYMTLKRLIVSHFLWMVRSPTPMATFCTKSTEKAESYYQGCVYFTLNILSSDMLIWQGPSLLRCLTLLQHSPVCSDLVKKCCLRQRWGKNDGSKMLPRYLAASWGLRAQLVICFSSEESVRCHPSRLLRSDFGKKWGLLCIVLWSSQVFFLCSPAE